MPAFKHSVLAVFAMVLLSSPASADTYEGVDYEADKSTTGRVGVGGYAYGNMDFVGDVDWIAVELLANHTYEIDLEGDTYDQGELEWPEIYGIIGPGHHSYGGSDGGKNGKIKISFNSGDTTAVWYIQIGSGNAGGYRLLVMEILPDDYTDDLSTTQRHLVYKGKCLYISV